MASDVPVPESLDFTDADIRKAAQRKTYAPGIHAQWIVKDVTKGGSKKGHLQLGCKVAALREPGDANSAEKRTMFDNMYIPLPNPQVPGHKAPDTLGLCIRNLHAMYPEEIPTYPQRVDGTIIYRGEEIEKGEEEAARKEVEDLVFAKLKELWADPSVLVNQSYYAVVKKDGEFTNLDRHSPEPVKDKDGNELPLTEAKNFYDLDDSEEADEESEAPVKTPAKGKPQTAGKNKKR